MARKVVIQFQMLDARLAWQTVRSPSWAAASHLGGEVYVALCHMQYVRLHDMATA
jgi:hypothetical protein